MDVGELFLVAAAVLDVDPADVFERADLDAVGRTLQAVPAEAPALEQAAALLHAITLERPFGDDSRAVALVAAAQVLELDNQVTTFRPNQHLFALLDAIAAGTADVEAVHSYLSLEVSRMFERFTPRARNVITFAYEEATALRHDYVGTEHLLLGVLRETEGIGAEVLVAFGVDVDVVRREIDHRVGQGSEPARKRSPFTSRSKKSLELALSEALQLGHNYIGTEHLLLGLLRVTEGLAAEILTDLYSIEIGQTRNEIVARLATGGWKPQRARRSKPFMRPPVTWASPIDPALVARRGRLLGDIQALLDENSRLRDEVAHLRMVLHQHGIDLGGEAGEQPA
ncbi:MAG: ATP-dependent Clp protease ATP-binding subunit ClpC [Acidimicrobiaceae bacterium]|jgi:hypothetical protein